MSIKINNTFEEFLDNINQKFNGFIDSNTYDYDILRAFYDLDSMIVNNIDEFLESLKFENKRGNDLDKSLSFFNIYRTKGNNGDIYSFEFKYTNKNPLIIKKDSIITFNKINYKVIKDEIFVSGKAVIVLCQKTFSDYKFSSPTFSAGGIVCFEGNDLELQEQESSVSQIVPKHINLLSVKRNVSEQESDFEFLEKSKSILQSYGYLNNEKIRIELLKDSRIRDLVFKNDNGITQIIIYPKLLYKIDEIMEYCQEVVDMYKTCNIQLLKPNVDEIVVSGLYDQLNGVTEKSKIIVEIENGIKDYLSNILIDRKIKRIDILNIINKKISEYSPNSKINYEYIHIYDYFYYRKDYKNPLEIFEITNYLSVTENVITFGRTE